MFDRPASIFDAALVGRLSDPDVREHVRAVFVPLVRARTIKQEVRKPEAAPVPISSWKPFQVTASERRPVLISERTVFNLVPCNRALEAGFAEFCNKATDIVAFAKNAGPQALRVDYLGDAGRPALYLPDFLVRGADGKHYLVETKGQVDRAVPR
ncbi:MAG TPA: hypothetical protein VLA73_07985 [Burkholderiales bacterium]|nr:hypothetical protein [Burkholderiales bacterium]